MSVENPQQVDFYLIKNAINEGQLKLASRLSSKLLGLHKRVMLITENRSVSERVDALMWSFSDTSFVPHDHISNLGQNIEKENNKTPQFNHIRITELETISQHTLSINYDVLINLCAKVPAIVEHFPRVIEIIAADNDAKTTGRLRYKEYQQKSTEIVTHQLEI